MSKKIIFCILTGIVIGVSVFVFLNIMNEDKDIVKEDIGREIDESERRVLHVSSLLWKPFVFEENGEFKGIAVDIMDNALKNLNVDYEFSILPWSRVLRMAETGEVDGVLVVTHKKEREDYLAYTHEQLAYGREEIIPEAYLVALDYVFFVKKINEDSFEFESINQVIEDKYLVGINQDYSYTPKINNASWNAVTHYNEAESFQALEKGEIDVFLANTEVGMNTLDEIGLSDKITYIENPVDTSYLFLVFSKNSDYPNLDELKKEIDKEFMRIYSSGGYEEIRKKYI